MAKDLQPLTVDLKEAIEKSISIPNEGKSVAEEEFRQGFDEVIHLQKDLFKDHLEHPESR